MSTVITVLLIVASILLTLVVLVQNAKGGGLAANFASGNQTFGVRQTADFLEKATWTLAIAILVLSVSATMFVPGGEGAANSVVPGQMENVLQGKSDFSNLPASTSTPQPLGDSTPAQ